MMSTRRLTTDAELRVFAERFAAVIRERSGGTIASQVSIEYLRRCRVRGVFDSRGEMIGGYAIGASLPLRLLEFVPEAERVLPPQGGTWDECCEIVCMWRTRALTSARMSRVWPHVVADTLRARKRFILGHSESARLDRFYTRRGAVTLYAGPSVNGHPSRLIAYRPRALVLELAKFLVVEAPLRLVRRRARG
jgi:hypothetical protein